MAATLNITDGTTTVNLLSAKVDYQLAASSGYPQSDPGLRQIRHESFFSEGESLISSQAKNIIDSFSLSIYGASQDAIATNLQKLATLAKKARDFHQSGWQKTPVYLTAKAVNETNTRYALVTDIRFSLGTSPFNSVFNSNTMLNKVAVQVEREPYWRSHAPLTLPTALTLSAPQAPGTQADTTEQYIVNFRDTNALTHLYNYDDSLTSFSANLIASSAFSYFPASPALNDIVYFGATGGPFRMVIFNIGVVGVFAATITWEFWNGAAWSSLANAIQSSSQMLLTLGRGSVIVDTPTGWAATTINTVSAFWIRARISAFTSWTTSPTQATQIVYNPRDCAISVANSQIKGDVNALGLIRSIMDRSMVHQIDLAGFGLKSRGLTNFTSRLNFGGQNPTGWTETYYTDTAQVADIEAPGGNRATCTFATTITSAERARFTLSDGAKAKDFEGVYQVYLRCQQVTGSAGDVQVRLSYVCANEISGSAVSLKLVGSGPELVQLGRIEIFPTQVITATDTGQQIEFRLYALASSATPDLYLYDLILVPIDEWSCVIGPAQSGGWAGGNRVELDAGLLRRRVTLQIAQSATLWSPSMMMEVRGDLPHFPPKVAFNIYGFMAETSGVSWRADNALHLRQFVFTHQRWLFMRGSE